MERTIKKIAFCTLAVAVVAASQSVLAHTRLQTSSAVEGTRVYNNATIGHGCEEAAAGQPRPAVIANSMVFPDGTDSTISIDGAVVEGAVVSDYISNWGGAISHVPTRAVFDKTRIEFGRGGLAGGNPVGNHSWKGRIPGDAHVGLVPIRIGAVDINADSCAKSVTFRVAIADICRITNIAGFNDHTVNLWTPAVGSKFDGVGLHGYNSPATYTVRRNLDENPLPDVDVNGNACGEGVDVTVDPSAAQLDNDLPIRGIWPKKK
jgi:hypothetical protein